MRTGTSTFLTLASTRSARDRPAWSTGPTGYLHHHWYHRPRVCSAMGGPAHSGFPGYLRLVFVFATAHLVGGSWAVSAARPEPVSAPAHADFSARALHGLTVALVIDHGSAVAHWPSDRTNSWGRQVYLDLCALCLRGSGRRPLPGPTELSGCGCLRRRLRTLRRPVDDWPPTRR